MAQPTPGPSAPWLEGEMEGYAYRQTLRQAALELSFRLEERVKMLQATDLSEANVFTEIRRQVAECGVEGNIGRASDLADLVGEIEQARTSRRL